MKTRNSKKGLSIAAAFALAASGLNAGAAQATETGLLWSAYGQTNELVGVQDSDFSLRYGFPSRFEVGSESETQTGDDGRLDDLTQSRVHAASKLLETSSDQIAARNTVRDSFSVSVTWIPEPGKTAPTIGALSVSDSPNPTSGVNTVNLVLETETVTDYVYTTLDGTFDDDGEGDPGELGEDGYQSRVTVTSTATATGRLVISSPSDLDYTMQLRVQITYPDGQKSEVETVTFLPAEDVDASLSIYPIFVGDDTVDGTFGLSGINTANFIQTNGVTVDLLLSDGDGGDANQTVSVSGLTGYVEITDAYELSFDDTNLPDDFTVAAGRTYTLTGSIGVKELNEYFTGVKTTSSIAKATRTTSVASSYDDMEISIANSTAISHNSTNEDTELVDKETVAVLEGTKTLVFTISLTNTVEGKVVAAGKDHEVTVTLSDSATNDLGTTTITAEGKSLKATDSNDGIYFTKKTNSSGQISFTVTADKAADGEMFMIDAVGTEGISLDDTWVVWQEARWTALPAVDGDVTIAPKGSVSLDYSVVDQFGNLANADYQLAVTRTPGAGSRDTAAEYANWSYAVPVSATGSASFTIVDNGAAVEGSDNVTVAVQKKASAGGAYLAVDPSVSDTFKLFYENDIAALTSTAKVNYNGIANAAGTAVLPIYIETDPLVNFDQRISNDRTALNKWEPNNFEADGVAAADDDITDADDLLRVFGTVVTTNNAPVAGVAVRISGAGMNFSDEKLRADVTRAKNDSIVVFTDATGSYEAFVRSSAAGRQTISVDAQGAKSSVEVRFQESTGVATTLTLTLPTNVTPGARADVVAKVVDKFGKPVANLTVYFKDNGPGILNDTEARTDVFGEAQLTLSTLAAESGTNTITVWATIGGETVSQTKTITVGNPVAGKVNVGSFNGKLVVYASGLQGSTISWKVGGTWGKAVASSNYAVFNRPTPRAGVTVSVDVYVNGVKTLTKSVVTR